MLTIQDMKCTQCGSASNTSVSVQVDGGERGLVRFRIDCNLCGGFSHYLDHGPVQRAVATYLERLAVLPPADAPLSQHLMAVVKRIGGHELLAVAIVPHEGEMSAVVYAGAGFSGVDWRVQMEQMADIVSEQAKKFEEEWEKRDERQK